MLPLLQITKPQNRDLECMVQVCSATSCKVSTIKKSPEALVLCYFPSIFAVPGSVMGTWQGKMQGTYVFLLCRLSHLAASPRCPRVGFLRGEWHGLHCIVITKKTIHSKSSGLEKISQESSVAQRGNLHPKAT